MGWRLYLIASASMFPAYFLWALRRGELQQDPLPGLLAIGVISLLTGLLAFTMAISTVEQVRRGEVSLNRARIAVAWPGAILLILVLAGYLFGV